MEELWEQIYEFTDYSISNLGRIRNDRRQRMVKQTLTNDGTVKVGLVRGGRQYTRSVKRIMADTFVEGRSEKFDTPVLLDGNPRNMRADNIVWRPRWFAWKYASQFVLTEKYLGKGPIRDRKTGQVYTDVVEAAVTNGLLFREILITLVNKTPIFPTWQVFDWARDEKEEN